MKRHVATRPGRSFCRRAALGADRSVKTGAPDKGFASQLSRELLKNRKPLQEAAAFMADLAKTATLILAPFGLLMFVAYLTEVGAPLPTLDASTAVLLLLVGGCFSFLVSLLLLVILMPLYACYVSPHDRKRIRTTPLFRVRRRRSLPTDNMHEELLVFHAPAS